MSCPIKGLPMFPEEAPNLLMKSQGMSQRPEAREFPAARKRPLSRLFTMFYDFLREFPSAWKRPLQAYAFISDPRMTFSHLLRCPKFVLMLGHRATMRTIALLAKTFLETNEQSTHLSSWLRVDICLHTEGRLWGAIHCRCYRSNSYVWGAAFLQGVAINSLDAM